jgi:hypothetical protein
MLKPSALILESYITQPFATKHLRSISAFAGWSILGVGFTKSSKLDNRRISAAFNQAWTAREEAQRVDIEIYFATILV